MFRVDSDGAFAKKPQNGMEAEMRNVLITGLCVWAMSAILAGCNNRAQIIDSSSGAPRSVEQAEELVAQSQSTVADLPLPVGFDLDQSRSRSFAGGSARYVDLVYEGRCDKTSLVSFFKKQMPANRWAITSYRFLQGQHTLDFEKDNERCSIIISEGSGLWKNTEIKVQLWPSGRIEQNGSQARR